MPPIICPACGRVYNSKYTYQKHARKKHNMEFTRKKRGPTRTFMPDASEEIRKKEMSKKCQEKHQPKRNIAGRQIRLACQVIKHPNQTDQQLLTQLSQTSQTIITEYLPDADDITLRLAGYWLLNLDWSSYVDISLLWSHGNGALSPDPPQEFYNNKRKNSLRSRSQKQMEAAEKSRKSAAIKRYHSHISNASDTLSRSFMHDNANNREKPHVRKYRILAHRYLLRHPEYLPEIQRIPENIVAKAHSKNARSRGSNNDVMDIESDDNDDNDDNADDDSINNGNDYLDNCNCYEDINNNSNDSSDDEFSPNTHAFTTSEMQHTVAY